MYQIFSDKFAIIHCFNEVCNPTEKMQHLIKLSECYCLSVIVGVILPRNFISTRECRVRDLSIVSNS